MVGAPTVSEALALHVAGLEFEKLPEVVIAAAKRIVLDTIGCALSKPPRPPAHPPKIHACRTRRLRHAFA